MNRRLVWLSGLTLAVIITVSACHKTVPPPTVPPPPPATAAAPPTPPPPPPPPPPAPAPAPRALSDEEVFARKSLEQLNAEKPLEDVYFDYDKSDLRPEGRSALQKDADFMKKWSSTVVTIEGHCDSRGSSEYNLALGNRRASAARDYLVSLGVPANRVTVISKGKEQPFCSEDGESCWQQNRRGHFVVTAK